MERLLTYLHPNPGWGKNGSDSQNRSIPSGTPKIVGKHCILELYDCELEKLNDEAFLRTIITSAAKSAGATLLNLITHKFEPQGVTGLALLAESHISIHTWPESGYAAVDVFTCGNHTMPERACEVLRKELSPKNYSLRSLDRETPGNLDKALREPSSIKQFQD